MKKTLLLLLGCTVSIFSFADGDGDPVSYPADIFQKPHKVPSRAPLISYQGGNILVVSPCDLDETEIVIRDVDGNIIYDMVTALPASTYVIPLPTDVIAAINSIELYYGENCIYGQI